MRRRRLSVEAFIELNQQVVQQSPTQFQVHRAPTFSLSPEGSHPDPHYQRYHLVRPPGRGGVGDVYLAWDWEMQREVALKLLRRVDDLNLLVQRLHREAQVAARLNHPNIITVYDIGADLRVEDKPPAHYISMAYVEGGTLGHAIKRGLALDNQLQLLEQVARGMGHAHQNQVIHRDLKPSNILLSEDGRAIITDFGLARWELDASTLTQTGEIMGTAFYMSPEQATGDKNSMDPRTDVWALGVMLYQILTGQVPFQGTSETVVLGAILRKTPVPPRQLRPQISEALEQVCLRALSKEQSGRQANGQVFADQLSSCRLPVQRSVAQHSRRIFASLQLSRTATLCLIGLSVAVLLLLAWAIQSHRELQQLRQQGTASNPPAAESGTSEPAANRSSAADKRLARLRKRTQSFYAILVSRQNDQLGSYITAPDAGPRP